MQIDATELKEQIELRQAARDQEAEIDRLVRPGRVLQQIHRLESCATSSQSQQSLHGRACRDGSKNCLEATIVDYLVFRSDVCEEHEIVITSHWKSYRAYLLASRSREDLD